MQWSATLIVVKYSNRIVSYHANYNVNPMLLTDTAGHIHLSLQDCVPGLKLVECVVYDAITTVIIQQSHWLPNFQKIVQTLLVRVIIPLNRSSQLN